MDKQAVSEQLRALARDDLKRSKAARLRDVIDEVEMALAAGVPRADVLAVLNAQGLDMTLATFETTLKRIRSAATRRGLAHPQVAPVPPSPVAEMPSQLAAAPTAAVKPESPPPPAGRTLDEIAASKPDLEALAKLAKRRKPK
jgi:hypothetical protein